MAPSFSIIFAVLFCALFYFSNRAHGVDGNFCVLQVDDHTLPAKCSQSLAKEGHSMTIMHRYGPCSSYNEAEPGVAQILARDALRVSSLQARVSSIDNENNTIREQSAVSLPTKNSLDIGYNNYVATIGLGTPSRAQTVVLDTGSDICWVQCQPCTSCYSQKEPIFNPSASSSYRRFPCNSTACARLNPQSCSSGFCGYSIRYLDGSGTTGFLSSDVLALTPSNLIQSFTFGCGLKNGGLFTGVAGLFGLGRGSFSLISQTASTLGNVFSYCLPFQTGSTGWFTLGQSSTPGAVYTPMLSNPRAPSFYFIDLIGISVGGTRLPVTAAVFRAAGTIIDSGTVITRLPPAAYSALRSAFRSAMLQYTLFQASTLDTCYDFSNTRGATHPIITLHYSGVDINFGTTGVFLPVGGSRYCLAFTSNPAATDLAIIGNVQQKTLQVIYDIGASKIGFVPGACS